MSIYPGFSTEAMEQIWSARIARGRDGRRRGRGRRTRRARSATSRRTPRWRSRWRRASPFPTIVLADGLDRRARRCCPCSTCSARGSTPTARRASPSGAHHARRRRHRAMLLARDATAELRRLGESAERALLSATERFGNRSTTARSFLQPAEQTTYAFGSGAGLRRSTHSAARAGVVPGAARWAHR